MSSSDWLMADSGESINAQRESSRYSADCAETVNHNQGTYFAISLSCSLPSLLASKILSKVSVYSFSFSSLTASLRAPFKKSRRKLCNQESWRLQSQFRGLRLARLARTIRTRLPEQWWNVQHAWVFFVHANFCWSDKLWARKFEYLVGCLGEKVRGRRRTIMSLRKTWNEYHDPERIMQPLMRSQRYLNFSERAEPRYECCKVSIRLTFNSSESINPFPSVSYLLQIWKRKEGSIE